MNNYVSMPRLPEGIVYFLFNIQWVLCAKYVNVSQRGEGIMGGGFSACDV